MSFTALMEATFAPYVLLIVFAFLPNEIWRIAGALLSRGLDENSEWLALVRAMATALLAGVVAKILLVPPDALAIVPIGMRTGAIAVAVIVYFISGRRAALAIIAGEALVIGAAAFA